MPHQTGQILINRYRIVRLLGQGGFGAVYRAWDINLNKPCAIKENLEVSSAADRQFFREAQILSSLSHPNLPRVTDHFKIEGQGQYLVMDFVEGEDLDSKFQHSGGPLSEAQVLTWIKQVGEALSYLHAQNPPIIHRDIKPANIRITPQGQAMLVDFGIAKIFDPHLRTTLGAQAVTPGYSPSEQYGQGSTDSRTDVYALGATMYHLLTGKIPIESIQRSLGTPLILPRQLNPTISPHLEAAILRSMELMPTRRFQSMAEFLTALSQPSGNQQVANLVIPPTSRVPGDPSQQALPYTQTIPPYSQAAFPQTQVAPPAAQSGLQSALRNPWIIGCLGSVALMVILASVVILLYAQQNKTLAFNLSTPTFTSTFTGTPTPTRFVAPSPTPIPTSLPPTTESPQLPTQPPPPPTSPPPTDLPPPSLFADNNYFCHQSPASSSEQHWTITKGQTYTILGMSQNGWWLVAIDDPRTRTKCCWVGGGVQEGDLSIVPYITYEIDRMNCPAPP